MPNFHVITDGGWVRRRAPGRGNPFRVSRPVRLLCTLAVSFASIAALVPAAATANSNAKLISEGKLAMRVETKQEEKEHLIPFKQSAVFIIGCKVHGNRVLCSEHSGPEKCVKGKPWMDISDLFPVIKGRIGESLNFGLTVTSIYCRKAS